MLHKLIFARNFEATPFLGGSCFSDATSKTLQEILRQLHFWEEVPFFLMLDKLIFARNFEATPFLGGSSIFF